MKRYLQVAELLRQQIQDHKLRPGDPLPSLRNQCESLKVSKNTIIHAYQLLEAEGLIEPRARSGYYVCHTPLQQTINVAPRPVKLGGLALSIISAASRMDLVPLGSADPESRFPARRQLYQTLARGARHRSEHQHNSNHYQPPPGDSLLRARLALHLSETAFDCQPQEIIICNGAQEGISLGLRAVAQQGEIIAVESPCFYGTLQCIEALGMKVLEIPSVQGEGINLKLLEDALKRWPIKALMMNPNINNPLGFQINSCRQAELMRITAPYDLPIIEDDVFGEMGYQSQRISPLKALDNSGRVVLCGSFSKTLDTDIRIGWVVPGRYYEEVNYIKYVTTIASPGLLQESCAHFMADRRYSRHLRTIKRTYKQRRDQFLNDLNRLIPREVSYSQPEGGYLCWLELPHYCNGDRIYEQALAAGIAITPGSLFSTGAEYQHCIRLNFAQYDGTSEISHALTRVSRLVEEELDNGEN